jgi:predicted nucleic acid binding AN1-type Zn finger protein
MVKSRCSHPNCKKKLHLTLLIIGTCRCGNYFCSEHRLNHNCTYDYKSETNKDDFIKENHCVPLKIEQI